VEVTPWRQYAGNQKQTLIPRGPNQTALSLPHFQDTHTTYINDKSVSKGMPAAQCFNVHVHDIVKTENLWEHPKHFLFVLTISVA
jgi:hypothetical protein